MAISVASKNQDCEADFVASSEKMNEIATNRTFMLMFDFFISYPKWSLSLFLFLASLGVPPIMDLPKATQLPYHRLDTFVQQEAHAYYKCTENAFALLDQEIIEAVNREEEKVLERQAFNLDLLKKIENLTSDRAYATRKAQEGLFQWNNRLGQPLPYFNDSISNNCSIYDRSYITTSLGRDFQELESEALSTVGDYRATSETSLALVRNYTQHRSDYDYNYFLRNRIEPALVLMGQLANQTLHSVEFSVNTLALVDELVRSLNHFKTLFEVARNRINSLTARAQIFVDNIREWRNKYSELLQRALKMAEVATPWIPTLRLPGGVGIDAKVFKLDGILLVNADSLLPNVAVEVPMFNELPDIERLLETFAKDSQRLIKDVLERVANDATAILKTATQDIINQIRELLTLDDYNPPQYQGSKPEIKTLNDEATHLSRVGEAAEAKTKKILDRVQRVQRISSSEIPLALPQVDPIDHSLAGTSTTFGYHDLAIPGSLAFIIELFETVITLTVKFNWIVEIVLQLWRLWLLKIKYEKDSIPDLPCVSGGPAESIETDDSDEWQEKVLGTLILFSRRVFTPQLFLFLLVLPIGVGTAKLWYPHVLNNCVKSKTGTVIATWWVVPFKINQANSPGNTLHKERELECLQRRRLVCDRIVAESMVAYTNDVETLSNLHNQYSDSDAIMSRLKRCFATDELDMKFRDACCGLEGYPLHCPLEPKMRAHQCPIDGLVRPAAAFLPIGAYLSEPASHSETIQSTLQDSRFDCEALQHICITTPCHGVNEDLVGSMVSEADCQAQLSIIRDIFFVLLVTFHAVMINFISPLIFNGVKCLGWEQLNPYGIMFSAQIDKNGNIGRGGSSQKRAERTKSVIIKFEFMGRLQVVLGTLVFIGWVLLSQIYVPQLLQG